MSLQLTTVQITPPASALGQRYFPHIGDLCAYLAHTAARHRQLSPLLVLVWFRLRRTLSRLDRLAVRWQRGRHHQNSCQGRPRIESPPAIHPGDAWLPRHTPRGDAWLIRLHQPLAQFAPRIQALLDDPEIAALCAAAPQAGRLLRPLCRMFGLAPPAGLALPPRREPPAKPPPPPPPPAEHSPHIWPFVPQRLRLRVPNLRRRKPRRRPQPP
jgi:hypothetical protein